MTKSSSSRHERRLVRKLGAPKKSFVDDPDRGTIDVAETLHLIGFGRTESYDLAVAIREGQLIEDREGALGFGLPSPIKGRVESLRQKSERESTRSDSLRRSLLAARLLIANRPETRESATKALDALLTLAANGGPVKLAQAVHALWLQDGKRRKHRVARKTH
jgi:hypothetical protein